MLIFVFTNRFEISSCVLKYSVDSQPTKKGVWKLNVFRHLLYSNIIANIVNTTRCYTTSIYSSLQ